MKKVKIKPNKVIRFHRYTPLTLSSQPSLNQFDLIEITWLDTTDASPWLTIDEALKEFENAEIFKTVGYFLKKSKDLYILTPSLHLNSDGEPAKTGGTWGIPIGCIKKIKKI